LLSITYVKHGRTKFVPAKPERENQALKTIEESSLSEQKEEPVITELDNEIDVRVVVT
jgi:hypothetical protein